MASANNTQDPLVVLTPGGCATPELNGADQQMAAWRWFEGGAQTQFGGGAVYTVDYAIPQQDSTGTMEVEVELVRYAPDLPTKMVYSCPELGNMNAEIESGTDGSCEARIADVAAAVEEATKAKLSDPEGLSLLGTDDTLVIESSSFEGVYVKAMNPGVVRGPAGRQNYQKIDVCKVEENGAEGNDD